MNKDELDNMQGEAKVNAKRKKLEIISLAELNKAINKWMLIEDEHVIKFICSVVVANSLKRDPVWIFLIGPSGGGKSEMLMGLEDLDITEYISNLTPKTFASGIKVREGEQDPSLLNRINNKILIFKDWTSILSMNFEARGEIMSQLREIYDGKFNKVFGNNQEVDWKGKIGIIAGVTPIVDLSQQMSAALGERFIHYRIKMPDRLEVARRSLENASKVFEMREDIKDAFLSFFMGVDTDIEIPDLPEKAKEEIIKVANFVTMARSGVIRASNMRQDVIFVPDPEMPTRITQQLNTVAEALMIINKGKYIESDMDIIYKIALDSIPKTNKIVILEMAREDNQTTASIATALDYPTDTIRRYLENLSLLGVCKRIKDGGTGDKWLMKEEFKAIIKDYDIIPELEDPAPVLTEEEEEILDEAYGEGAAGTLL